MSVDSRPGSEAGPPKATLFCPECGHESEATGDWEARERRERTVLVCPSCGSDVATRGRTPGLACH